MPPSAHTPSFGEELRSIVDHAEALLRALTDEGDPRFEALRERVAASIDTARARLEQLEHDAQTPSERVAAAVENWLRANPWTAIAIGASVGLVIGLLLSGPRGRGATEVPGGS